MLDHRAGGDFADALALQAEALDQRAQRGGEHVLIAGLVVRTIGAREGNARAADDRDSHEVILPRATSLR